MSEQTPAPPPKEIPNSNWFKWGQEAGKKKTPLKKTILKNLRLGCRQYDEFLFGYDNPNLS